jgi:transposase
MRRIRDRVGGLDVHKDSVVACARVVLGEEVSVDKQRFGTTMREVRALRDWLADHELTTVVMEATGQYWKPVYYGLEGFFEELWLCNAQHVKNVPGRKTDMSDAEWLADVAAHGMVRPSLVPDEPARAVRDLTRYRKTQIDERAREIQRIDKVLQDAGIKLSSVSSRILNRSTREMLEALIAGERDPAVLAEMAKTRMRSKIPQLEEALEGRFRAHHAEMCRRLLAHIDFLDESIAALDGSIEEHLRPFEPAIALLCSIVGWQRRTAEVFWAETGGDMTRFPSGAHLASWMRLAPGNHESAGKRHRVGTGPGTTYLGRALIEAAKAAARSNDTYFAAKYRRIAARRGPNKAAVALAHAMVVTAWHMLSTGERYNDPGGDYFERRREPQHQAERLARRIRELGFDVTLTTAA